MAWNILHGGGTRRLPEITLALLEHAADVVVLTEFRRSLGGQIRGVLDDHGWAHQVSTDPPAGQNGILIAARSKLECQVDDSAEESRGSRLLQVSLPQMDMVILAAHVPDKSRPTARTACWRAVLRVAREHRDAPCIVLGDFNTGRHRLDEQGRTFNCTALLGELAALGYADAWRLLHPDEREFSWYSHAGNGFRIDSAFVSTPLRGSVREAFYSHHERRNRVSDHSPFIMALG